MSGFLCVLPLIGGLVAGCGVEPPLAFGYVEGEYVNLAPVSTGQLALVEVEKGERVALGEIVARQDRTDTEIALAEARAARAEAAAELEDLRQGSRPEEIAVRKAALASARARLGEAERTAERQSELASTGVISKALLDRDLAARDVARAEVEALEAELEVARLPARRQVVIAAQNRLEGADAAVRQAEWRLDQRNLAAPAAGEIADVFQRAGEISGPATPVVSLLPDGAVKLVVFVGETDLARLSPGMILGMTCDNCPVDLQATISHISDDPEFTPPVIYSVETRQKLVYRIEAHPVPGTAPLRPGQIVDVRPAPL